MDMLSTIAALAGVVIAVGALIISVRVATVSQKDLTLTAYANAIQGGILDLKRIFSEQPHIFEKQMELNSDIPEHIPDYMRNDIPTFLAFSGGMWRLSYMFSVWKRGEELGLSSGECEGLEKEMLLWLQHVPGFFDVYRTHTSAFRAHNPRFLEFLEEEVYNSEFLAQRAIASAAIPTLSSGPTHRIDRRDAVEEGPAGPQPSSASAEDPG
jgi:hypothetical protein